MRKSSVIVQVLVSDEHLDRLDAIAARLADLGLNVEQKLHAVGIVAGTVDRDRIGHLGQVEGVDGVEISQEVVLPDPGSKLQ